ncbi:MAG: hypothetical protein IBJ03_19180 [Gemmatimonadaceae bacterium]|nr:hypothetical protein [Gemmatimonadaceae bacterium]
MTRLLLPLCVAILFAGLPSTTHAQRLRDRIAQLFFFPSGDVPVNQGGHPHPVTAASIQSGSPIVFLSNAMAASVANVPIGATTSGETFRFEGGVPVSTATSAGPIFAERGQTLGRGRVLAGMNRSTFQFSTLRGRPLSAIDITLVHENDNFAGCSAANGGQDCAKYGVPVYENDATRFDLDLDLAVNVTTFYTTLGVTDRIDFGVVIPIQQVSFSGTNVAQIMPFGGPPVTHIFGGTPMNPVLRATNTSKGDAFGIGDVAARLKVNAFNTATTAVALLADARFPTGDAQDLLGLDHFVLRSQAVISSRFGDFSPHLNTGFLYRAGGQQNHSVLATAGFDHLLGRKVTLALDVVSEFQIGANRLLLPGPVQYEAPYPRTINPTSIPDIRDDLINGSVGFKFNATRNLLFVTNALIPLNDGGMRANYTWTFGVEYAF